MAASDFRPVLYLKDKCPFCMKVRLFMLEAGLLGDVEVREFVPGTDEEQKIKDELSPHLEKVTFPAAQTEPGRYLADSDGIISQFAAKANVDPAAMPVLQAYITGPFTSLMNLFRENMELKKQLA